MKKILENLEDFSTTAVGGLLFGFIAASGLIDADWAVIQVAWSQWAAASQQLYAAASSVKIGQISIAAGIAFLMQRHKAKK